LAKSWDPEKVISPQYTGAFDGGSKPNPGQMTIGGWIADPNRKTILKFSENIGYGTNNEAEYRAFIRLIKEAKILGIESISIRGDSALVVNQVNGKWKVKVSKIQELRNQALHEMKGMDIILTHVLRKYNTIADSLT